MKQNAVEMQCGVRLLVAGVLVAAAFCAIPALADKDAFVCMEETQEKCDHENRNIQLFVQGRDAYERGRETGDLGAARKFALELIERKDTRHGKALMKYIYMQVAQGVHKDPVEAYRWVAADIAAQASYERLNLARVLEQLAAKMTPEQLAEARR
jgi:hypothetical protein